MSPACLVFYGDARKLPKGECKPCDCHPDGSDHRKASDCEPRTGQCRCNDNIAGRRCEECLPGYWGMREGEGCRPCLCDGPGVAGTRCHPLTGQCICIDGVTGEECDRCADHWYGTSTTQCHPCDCHHGGAQTLQCEYNTGTCRCQTNAIGDKCDMCKENTYNITEGCLNCPPCYDFIKDAADAFRTLISDVEILCNSTKQGHPDTSQGPEDLVQEILTTAKILQEVFVNAFGKYYGTNGPPLLQLEDADQAVSWVETRCNNITEKIYDIMVIQDEMVDNVTNSGSQLDTVAMLLDTTFASIEDGRTILDIAKMTTVYHGPLSDRMTAIAKEARVFSKLLLMVSQKISERAEEALVSARSANKLIHSLSQHNRKFARAIDNTTITWAIRESNFRQGRSFAESVHAEAAGAYDEALGLFTSVTGLRIPRHKVRVNKTTTELEEARAKSKRITHRSSKLRDRYDMLAESTEFLILDSEDYLDSATREGMRAERQRSKVERALNISSKATAKARTIIENAQRTLETLEDFDHQAKGHKEDAIKSSENIQPAINQIRKAEEEMADSKSILSNSLELARNATDGATISHSKAVLASNSTHQTLEDLAVIKKKSIDVKMAAVSASSNMKSLTFQWADRERQSNMDRLLSEAAIEDTEDTRIVAAKSTEAMESTLHTLNTLLDTIDALGDSQLQHMKLDMLEESLDEVKRSWVNSPIHAKKAALDEAIHKQGLWINLFADELLAVKRDVDEMKIIEATVPKTCHSKVKLEPTNPAREKRRHVK